VIFSMQIPLKSHSRLVEGFWWVLVG